MSGSFESVRWECMRAHTGPRFKLSSERVLGKGVRTHVNSKGEIPSIRQLQAGSNPRCCITPGSDPTHQQLSCYGPNLTSKISESPSAELCTACLTVCNLIAFHIMKLISLVIYSMLHVFSVLVFATPNLNTYTLITYLTGP